MYSFLILGFIKGAGEVGGNSDPDRLVSQLVRRRLDRRSLEYAVKTVGTTKKALMAEINAARIGGETPGSSRSGSTPSSAGLWATARCGSPAPR